MTRALYLDIVGGIAGDMFLGALLDAGASEERLQEVPHALGIGGVEIRVSRVERHGIGALHVQVVPPPDPPPRTWRRMRELIESAELPARAQARALEPLARLAEAEAAIHGAPVDDVHFHELGGIDTHVDVCGVAVLLDDLGVDRVFSAPVPITRGLKKTAHGILPLPAPATIAVLRGAQIEGSGAGGELVTPTGAALAVSLAESFGQLPALTLEQVGYGSGTDDFPDRPNLLRVLVGDVAGAPAAGEVVLLETNLDDLSPELVPDAVARCYAAGALDVWVVRAQMKSRPGIVLAALARPPAERAVATAILEETSALGVRVSTAHRYELAREERSVVVAGEEIRVKLGRLDGRVVNVAPEYDDCAAAARRLGRPVEAVWAEALSRAQTAPPHSQA